MVRRSSAATRRMIIRPSQPGPVAGATALAGCGDRSGRGDVGDDDGDVVRRAGLVGQLDQLLAALLTVGVGAAAPRAIAASST